MRREYDFSNAKPNPYAKRYARGTNVVLLDKDVAKSFPDSKSVNDALRGLQQVMRAAKTSGWRRRKR